MTTIPIFRRRQRQRKPHSAGVSLLSFFLGGIGVLFLGVLALAAGTLVVSAAVGLNAYNSYVKDLPDPSSISTETSQQFKTTRIYDRTGTVLLYELFDPTGGNRTHVKLNRIPQSCIDVSVALEDKSFWSNAGVDPFAFGRALYVTLIRQSQIQGASTITQQLVKNVLIPVEDRAKPLVDRKVKEMILAYEITRRYTKEQILEWYLNTNYYGGVAYGLEAAADYYFGKHAQDLTLSECATLAEISNSPAYNPIDNPDDALKRRDIALDQLLLIFPDRYTSKQIVDAKKEKIVVVQKKFEIKAPHFAIYVRNVLIDRFGADVVNRGGLTVYTTLDWNAYQMAEQVAREQIKKLTEEKRNVTNASVVVIRPSTGEVVALVGSVDYFDKNIDGQVNIATAARQPGSSFKLFNYLTAFSKGMSPATVVYDVRTAFDDSPNPPFTPENYDRKYHGPVSLRTALGSSFNIPAVLVLQKTGVRDVVNTAHRLGINTLNREKYGLALTLGGGEVSLLDMAYAFGVVGNGGVMAGVGVPIEQQKPGYRTLDPVVVLKVNDANGKTIYEYNKPETQQVVTPQVAYLITDVLSDNNARAPGFGLNSVLKLTRPAAVKTGTTSDWKDNWTVGYTPDYVVGVWVGNANGAEMEHISGITGAAPIWAQVMERLHQNLPVKPFVEPPDMVHLNVCAASGLLPTPYCPQIVKEIFIKGQEPKEPDNIYKPFRIYKPNGKLATAQDPPDQVATMVFPIYPPEAQDWARENNIPQPPTEFDTTYLASTADGRVAILSPAAYTSVKGTVEVRGNVRLDDLERWRVAFGSGLDPTQWTEIGAGNGRVENGVLAAWPAGGLNGLYTLQLTAIDRGGGPHVATAQLTVDNTPPTVDIINPGEGDTFLKEKDEWVSLDVKALDNLAMSRVDFYVDDRKVGSTTVAPYSLKWTITMNDAITPTLKASKELSITMQVITTTITATQEIAVGTNITANVTAPIKRKDERATVDLPNGYSVLWDGKTMTETHTIKIMAFDAAGNNKESKKVRFQVAHKPPDPNKKTGVWIEEGWLQDPWVWLWEIVPPALRRWPA